MKNIHILRLRPASLILATALLSSVVSHAAVYTEGHADLGVAYEDGELDFHFHGEGAVIDGLEVEDQEYDPADIIIRGASTSMRAAGLDGVALGKSVDDTIYVLPWNQEPGLPYLGTASEELNPADWNGGITFTLTGLVSPSGSGQFAMWRYGVFGELMIDISSSGGPNSVTTPTGSHDHFNFGFTEPGDWYVTLTASGVHVTDGLVSDTQTFHFQIIPEPTSALLASLGAVGFLIRRRR